MIFEILTLNRFSNGVLHCTPRFFRFQYHRSGDPAYLLALFRFLHTLLLGFGPIYMKLETCSVGISVYKDSHFWVFRTKQCTLKGCFFSVFSIHKYSHFMFRAQINLITNLSLEITSGIPLRSYMSTCPKKSSLPNGV